MSHRFLVGARQLHADFVDFSPDQAHQIRTVLRLRAGDEVRVFDGVNPHDWLVRLADAARGEVIDKCPQAPEPRTRLVAYPALLQRDKFESVLQKLTELGVAAIGPVVTARSLVREPLDERRTARWRNILREATEQCGGGRVPELLPAVPFVDAVRQAEGRVIVAYERERHAGLPDALVDRPATVSVFVGPEGGFTPDEVDCARGAGARIVTLGTRILRTETASPVLAALVLYELGDLSWPANDD